MRSASVRMAGNKIMKIREFIQTTFRERADKAGALVVFHGRLPHYSAPNRSAVSRHAYTLHVVDASAAYAPENWLQRDGALPVRGFV